MQQSCEEVYLVDGLSVCALPLCCMTATNNIAMTLKDKREIKTNWVFQFFKTNCLINK